MRRSRIKMLPVKPADFRCKSAPQYPYNEMPLSLGLSEPVHAVTAERDIKVRVSDGHMIALDVYRPDSNGVFPALLAMSSYTKELQASDSPSLCNEAGDIEFFVSRGYVHVIADSRGSGHTGGSFELFGDREITDCAELVEWVAGQPWCSGKVGMIGMSYFAVVQLLTALKNPPHLKCIFAYDPIYDLYRDCCYHGGKMSLFNFLMAYFWTAGHLAFRKDSLGGKNRLGWATFLRLGIDFIMQRHKFDDAWMQERSGYWKKGPCTVPLYVGSGWEYAVGLHLRGVFDAYRDFQGPKRLLVGPPQVPFRPYSSWRIESLRWYDHWLKGKDTGIEKDPPVNIWVMGRNAWRSEQEWPITGTNYRNLYLKPSGRSRKLGLLHIDPPVEEEKCLSYLSWPLSPGLFGMPQLVYRSPILRRACEVTGHIVLRLFASCTAPDTGFFVKLSDEDETGVFRVLTKGWLKASHREIDEVRSLPYRPFHPHTREQKLEPGRVYEFLIEIWPASNLFHIGHRIRIDISCAESLYFDFPYTHFPSPRVGRVSIYSSPEYPSAITLPFIDSEPVFDNEGSGVMFSDEPSGYFAIRGKHLRCGPGTEFPVS